MHSPQVMGNPMNRLIPFLAFVSVSCLVHAEPVKLLCKPFTSSGKSYAFEIEIDREKNTVLVDGQYTTNPSISNYVTSFDLAEGDGGYAFHIYANGRAIASNLKDKSSLVMQCE